MIDSRPWTHLNLPYHLLEIELPSQILAVALVGLVVTVNCAKAIFTRQSITGNK